MYRFKYTGELTRKISVDDKTHWLERNDEVIISDGRVANSLSNDKFFVLLPFEVVKKKRKKKLRRTKKKKPAKKRQKDERGRLNCTPRLTT